MRLEFKNPSKSRRQKRMRRSVGNEKAQTRGAHRVCSLTSPKSSHTSVHSLTSPCSSSATTLFLMKTMMMVVWFFILHTRIMLWKILWDMVEIKYVTINVVRCPRLFPLGSRLKEVDEITLLDSEVVVRCLFVLMYQKKQQKVSMGESAYVIACVSNISLCQRCVGRSYSKGNAIMNE